MWTSKRRTAPVGAAKLPIFEAINRRTGMGLGEPLIRRGRPDSDENSPKPSSVHAKRPPDLEHHRTGTLPNFKHLTRKPPARTVDTVCAPPSAGEAIPAFTKASFPS